MSTARDTFVYPEAPDSLNLTLGSNITTVNSISPEEDDHASAGYITPTERETNDRAKWNNNILSPTGFL